VRRCSRFWADHRSRYELKIEWPGRSAAIRAQRATPPYFLPSRTTPTAPSQLMASKGERMPRFQDIPQFTRTASYAVDICWDHLLASLDRYINEWKLEIDPDFQRAHVWDDEKRRRYVEFILRGGMTGLDIYTNCPGWHRGSVGNFVLVDGKQRLEAVTRFLRNELPVFDGTYYREYTDHLRLRAKFRWHVNDLETRAEVLQWYLDLNSGGVVHTSEELERVRALLAAEAK